MAPGKLRTVREAISPSVRAWIVEHARARRVSGNWVSTPLNLASIELIRDQVRLAANAGPAKPCLVCVYRLWDGSSGLGTRVGGRPWRDPARPWPLDGRGRPLPFACQFDFGPAAAVGLSAPERLLLVFSRSLSGHAGMRLHTEWQPEAGGELWAGELPTFRDCPVALEAVPLLGEEYADGLAACANVPGGGHVPVYYGTKLGGVRPDKVYKRWLDLMIAAGKARKELDYDYEEPWETYFDVRGFTARQRPYWTEPRGRRFLCSLGSIVVRSPLEGGVILGEHLPEGWGYVGGEKHTLLMIGDAKAVAFFADDAGAVTWNIAG